MAEWVETLRERFNGNVNRVRKLVETYAELIDGRAGRPSVEKTDVLRAAVVLLHATLEDLIRTVGEERLPLVADEETLDKMSMVGRGNPSKFSLGALSRHRGRSVEEVLRESVEAHLTRSSYNNPGQIAKLLDAAKIDPKLVMPEKNHIGAMMARRHWIAHRADRNTRVGRGHHATRPLGKPAVELWIHAVESVGARILTALESES